LAFAPAPIFVISVRKIRALLGQTARLPSEQEWGEFPAMTIDELMNLAASAAAESPNRVRQVGAAILLTDGRPPVAACNTFPRGVQDIDWRHEGDGRFIWMEHAERNAIYAAARDGRKLAGATIATTFFPCIDCSRAIVQCGIATLVAPAPAYDDPVWGSVFPRSVAILQEGGVIFAHPATAG
jgi:dCMP deaminase